MVKVGSVCVDKFEASVWSRPDGGTQYGTTSDNYPCDDDGQDCEGAIFARSVPGVAPSRFITYFQAQQALANSGKHLTTNGEWQMAVAGTPDPGASPGADDCNTSSSGPVATGSRTNCVSDHGAHDMIGNVGEWVDHWLAFPTNCGSWGSFSDDQMCLLGAHTSVQGAATLVRGGSYDFGAPAGAFAVTGEETNETNNHFRYGFRGAR